MPKSRKWPFAPGFPTKTMHSFLGTHSVRSFNTRTNLYVPEIAYKIPGLVARINYEYLNAVPNINMFLTNSMEKCP